jgi:hypothetical protein
MINRDLKAYQTKSVNLRQVAVLAAATITSNVHSSVKECDGKSGERPDAAAEAAMRHLREAAGGRSRSAWARSWRRRPGTRPLQASMRPELLFLPEGVDGAEQRLSWWSRLLRGRVVRLRRRRRTAGLGKLLASTRERSCGILRWVR